MSKSKVNQISRASRELKEGTFLQNARQRNQRRKSAWNFLLLAWVPLWLLFVFLGSVMFWYLHISIYSEHTSIREFWRGALDLPRLLMLIPTLLATLPVAMFVTNVLVYLIPPARRAMEEEDRDVPGVDYRSSQNALLKTSAVSLVIALILGSIGAAMNVNLH